MKNEDIKFPAVYILHTVSGETPVCQVHADKGQAIFRFMGAHTNLTPCEVPTECTNCLNGQKP